MTALTDFCRDRRANTAFEVAILAIYLGVPTIAFIEALKLAIAWAYGDMQTALSWSGSLL